MATAWDKFQELIKDEMRKVYSETAIDHAMNPRSVGNMDAADGYASVTGPCGDTMDIWLRVKGDTIVEATFMTDGCGTTIAAGSMVTEMVKGKSVNQALRIGQENVLAALDGLPEESKHCALLAANTLKAAVKDYLAFKKEPWKRAYKVDR
ncbi:iron-sulfur cluster assembly scaffold protein [Chloroflexota bacterium]